MANATAVQTDPFAELDAAKTAANSAAVSAPSGNDPFADLDAAKMSPASKMTAGETAADYAKSIGSGAVTLATGVAGLPGDIKDFAQWTANHAISGLSGKPYNQVASENAAANKKLEAYSLLPSSPDSQEVANLASNNIPGAKEAINFQPQTKIGPYLKTASRCWI